MAMSATASQMMECSRDLRTVAPQVKGPWLATSAPGTSTAFCQTSGSSSKICSALANSHSEEIRPPYRRNQGLQLIRK